MTRLFNGFLSRDDIPRDTQASHLTLIPKPDKDHTLRGNYRPIALLNSDLNVFTKLLSLCLNLVLPSVVHKDQVGFVPGRQAGDNTRRVINLIDIINRQDTEALLLSLDAEKAFDMLSWPFLFSTLEYLGFRGSFPRAIRHLYAIPSASIKTPFVVSPPFPISNGTRQGCPLSPLLFTLCIKPLAAQIRQDTNISGIMVRGCTTLPNLHRLLEKFGSLSGYKINAAK